MRRGRGVIERNDTLRCVFGHVRARAKTFASVFGVRIASAAPPRAASTTSPTSNIEREVGRGGREDSEEWDNERYPNPNPIPPPFPPLFPICPHICPLFPTPLSQRPIGLGGEIQNYRNQGEREEREERDGREEREDREEREEREGRGER